MKMPPETPQEILYRAVGWESVDDHIIGNLWFRSHASYRKVEQGDKEEGIGSHILQDGTPCNDIDDNFPTQPAFFMSFSETIEGSLADDNRKNYTVLRLLDPVGFMEEIQGNVLNSDFVKVEWIKMKYIKSKNYDPKTESKISTLDRKYRCKCPKYAAEKEWRLQIKFLYNFRIMNDILKFRWLSFQDTFFDFAPPKD